MSYITNAPQNNETRMPLNLSCTKINGTKSKEAHKKEDT